MHNSEKKSNAKVKSVYESDSDEDLMAMAHQFMTAGSLSRSQLPLAAASASELPLKTTTASMAATSATIKGSHDQTGSDAHGLESTLHVEPSMSLESTRSNNGLFVNTRAQKAKDYFESRYAAPSGSPISPILNAAPFSSSTGQTSLASTPSIASTHSPSSLEPVTSATSATSKRAWTLLRQGPVLALTPNLNTYSSTAQPTVANKDRHPLQKLKDKFKAKIHSQSGKLKMKDNEKDDRASSDPERGLTPSLKRMTLSQYLSSRKKDASPKARPAEQFQYDSVLGDRNEFDFESESELETDTDVDHDATTTERELRQQQTSLSQPLPSFPLLELSPLSQPSMVVAGKGSSLVHPITTFEEIMVQYRSLHAFSAESKHKIPTQFNIPLAPCKTFYTESACRSPSMLKCIHFDSTNDTRSTLVHHALVSDLSLLLSTSMKNLSDATGVQKTVKRSLQLPDENEAGRMRPDMSLAEIKKQSEFMVHDFGTTMTRSQVRLSEEIHHSLRQLESQMSDRLPKMQQAVQELNDDHSKDQSRTGLWRLRLDQEFLYLLLSYLLAGLAQLIWFFQTCKRWTMALWRKLTSGNDAA